MVSKLNVPNYAMFDNYKLIIKPELHRDEETRTHYEKQHDGNLEVSLFDVVNYTVL